MYNSNPSPYASELVNSSAAMPNPYDNLPSYGLESVVEPKMPYDLTMTLQEAKSYFLQEYIPKVAMERGRLNERT